MKRTTLDSLLVLVLVLVLAAACGGDEPDPADSVLAPPPVAAAQQGAGAPAPAAAPARPRPAAPDPAALATAEMAKAPLLRTVQVAALDAATARDWVDRLQKDGIPAYSTTAVVGGQEFSRLRIGVAITGDEARAIAARIQARYHWPVWITTVDDRSVVSGSTLVASRSYAGK